MSDQKMNGHQAEPAATEVSQIRDFMKNFINPIIVSAVNGIIHSLAQVPIEETMVMTCGLFGRMIGNTLSIGDLAPVLQLRKRCKDAFFEEMGKVPVRPMPGTMAASPNAMRMPDGH